MAGPRDQSSFLAAVAETELQLALRLYRLVAEPLARNLLGLPA